MLSNKNLCLGSAASEVSGLVGVLQISEDQLNSLSLEHLASGLYEQAGSLSDSVTEITGFTEWVGSAALPVSIGWDWVITHTDNQTQLQLQGQPFSNLRIEGEAGKAISYEKGLEKLEGKIGSLDWEAIVFSAIRG